MLNYNESPTYNLSRRCDETGLSATSKANLLALYKTLGQLGFACGQPGTPLIDAEFQTFAQNTLGALASLSDISVLKRLLFEAHTLTLAQLRETVTNPDAPTTRKLPPVEREAKMRQLKARLTGVVIERQLEPSYELLDSVVQQWESRQLRYLTPEKCSSREFEVTMSKSSRQISLDADKMVVKESKTTPDQFAGTEMLVFEALRRRGIAYAFADVISWQTHERYLQSLFSHLRNDPPAGYNKPTLQQVLKADRQTFMKLIQDDVPVRRDSMNVLALDNQLLAALSSYDVGFHLLPLPKPAGKGDRGWPKGQGEKGDHWWTRGHADGHRDQPYTKGKGKGKSKHKSKDRPNLLPKELQHKDNVSTDVHQRRLCFNYNMGKCQDAPDGGQCNRGHHFCVRKGCHAPHPVSQHNVADKE